MANVDASIDVDMLAHELVDDAHNVREGPNSDAEHIVASKVEAQLSIDPEFAPMQFDGPPSRSPSHGTLSLRALSVPFSALGEVLHPKAVKRDGLAIIVPPAQNRWEYQVFQGDDEVEEILEEYDDAGFLEYLVLFTDGSEDVVSVALAYHPSTPTLVRLSSASPSILMLDCLYLYMHPSFPPHLHAIPTNHATSFPPHTHQRIPPFTSPHHQ